MFVGGFYTSIGGVARNSLASIVPNTRAPHAQQIIGRHDIDSIGQSNVAEYMGTP